MDKKDPPQTVICWKGTAGIENAGKRKKELLDAFSTTSAVALDISTLEDIDITGIQIIIAAKKEAEKIHKKFSLTENIPDFISSFTAAAGINLDNFTIGCTREKIHAGAD
jgi:anti-anti-sigma regulatory factor